MIGAVNAIGETLLGDAYTPLRVGAPPASPQPPGEGPAVELLLTGRDGWDEDGIELDPATDARTPANQLAEARFLAARLRELADQGVERGEMVVLLRAFTRLDAYEDSLERAGLRPYVVGGRGYWSQQQVADVCALLATIANPLDDQALLGAARLARLRGRARHALAAARRGGPAAGTSGRPSSRRPGLGEDERADPERLGADPRRRSSSLLRALRRDARRAAPARHLALASPA